MGHYSKNIPKKIAITLVGNKKHSAFSEFADKEMQFWFSYGDKKLHYGRGHLEGTINLNKKGKFYYEKNKETWS